MISTISANCDVAFCALAVIIADFTDLHTTLPFSTSLLLLTYSRFSLFMSASPTIAPSIPSPMDARREKGKRESCLITAETANHIINQIVNHSDGPRLLMSLCVVWGQNGGSVGFFFVIILRRTPHVKYHCSRHGEPRCSSSMCV